MFGTNRKVNQLEITSEWTELNELIKMHPENHGMLWEMATNALQKQMSIIHHNSFSPGGRLNKKDGLTRYGNSHVKDKTS